MTARTYLTIASAAVFAGMVAMFLVYVLVFRGAGESEFRDNCNSLHGVVSQTLDGLVCRYNQEEVLHYE